MRNRLPVRVYLHGQPAGDTVLPAGSAVYGSAAHPVNLAWVDIYRGMLTVSIATTYTVRHMPGCGLDFTLESTERGTP